MVVNPRSVSLSCLQVRSCFCTPITTRVPQQQNQQIHKFHHQPILAILGQQQQQHKTTTRTTTGGGGGGGISVAAAAGLVQCRSYSTTTTTTITTKPVVDPIQDGEMNNLIHYLPVPCPSSYIHLLSSDYITRARDRVTHSISKSPESFLWTRVILPGIHQEMIKTLLHQFNTQ